MDAVQSSAPAYVDRFPSHTHPVFRRSAQVALHRALIFEEQRLFADALSLALSHLRVEVIRMSRTEDPPELVLQRLRPSLVLIDLDSPAGDGLEFGRRVLRAVPTAKVLLLTGTRDPRAVQAVLEEGFHGYLSRDMRGEDFLAGVQAALDGKVLMPYTPPRPKTLGVPGTDEADLLARHLTLREREVLQLMVEGLASEDIAQRLWISLHTVRTHVQGILSKLQVHSRLEATAFAVRHGIVGR